MSAHTPGNWQIETSIDAVRVMSPDSSGTIAHVTIGINGVENANARLIAEAPAMLELLRKIHRVDSDGIDTLRSMGIKPARITLEVMHEIAALIAKIEASK